MTSLLRRHWDAAWASLGVQPTVDAARGGLFEQLCAAYSQPHRRYHTLQHLGECLDLWARDVGMAQHPGEVGIALWFHDAVYEHGRGDNEAASADWAASALRDAGAGDGVAQRVHALVMATRHSQAPVTLDEQLLVDVDLSILGAPPARFAEYERQIRDEYAHVPEPLFSQKRLQVLQSFADRPRIYATDAYRQRFEAQARANLAAAINACRAAS